MATPWIDIKWPKADQDALSRQINRLADQSGRGIADAVRWGAWYMAKSAGASTKRSKSRRNPLMNKGQYYDPDHPAEEYPFVVKIWSQRRRTPKIFYIHKTLAESKAEARKLDIAEIKRAGLAKSAWGWTVSKMGKNATPERAEGRRFARVNDRTRLGGSNPSVEVSNVLRYAADAMTLKGDRAIDTIPKRAARAMEKAIDRRVRKQWRR